MSIGNTLPNVPESSANPATQLIDFDALWDFDRPDESERRFREVLESAPDDASYRAELLTQIARSQGLQRKFDEAHITLDQIEVMLMDDLARARVRYLLERGRAFNSSRQPNRAVPLFRQAFDQALATHEDYLAIDAAHMLGIADEPDRAMAWNLKALELAEATSDARSKKWLGSLYNNIGWAYFDRHEYERALDCFEKALKERELRGSAADVRIAKWCVAKALRLLERVDEALKMQLELSAEFERIGGKDGYVHEELAECLWQLNRCEEARPHFTAAHRLLSQDPWLVENEPARLERLRQSGEQAC
jgi:tetratricopeptide (TPR) repeat protein